MTYGRLLERRKNGVYYFRQVYQYNNKQISKRFSLRTTDIVQARFMALQFKARIEMIDFNNLKKFDVAYDDNGNIKSVSVKNENDAQNLQEFLKLQELHKAESHKRDIEKIKFQQSLIEKDLLDKKKEEFFDSEKGQLYEKLQSKLKPKEKLTELKNTYISDLEVTENTKYKYNLFIGKFIDYANSEKVYDLAGVDRKLIYSYLLHLRKQDGKSDSTIKNIFNNLSSFYNHLLQIGETEQVNPFVGHKLKDTKDEDSRLPFSNEELQKIFSNDQLKLNKKLFFVCLLLVTTGARPNEICQLWTDDIYQDNGIYKIRIVENENRNQSLKTKSSKRIIYLNSILEKFGFIEYLKSQKIGMIFDLKKPSKKTYSTFISSDLTEILRSIGIEKKTMYCFRHTVVNRLKQNLILQSINEDLVGHEGKGTNATVYSQQHSAENLKKETEEILQYKEISFFS